MSTSHAPAAAGHHHPEPPEARRPWTVLGLMLAAQFMNKASQSTHEPSRD